MPEIHIELLKGRSPEQIKNMVQAVTDVVADTANAAPENIHIIVSEFEADHYSIGGKLKSDQ